MKNHTKLLFSTIVNLILMNFTSATTISEIESSANLVEKIFPGQINLQEISFKNSIQDYIIFKVESSQSEVNLKGIEFYDDKVFKKITEDYLVPTNSLIKLEFNSEEDDDAENLQLFTKQKGLTASTEELIIKYNNQYFDFVCWYKDPPATSETTEFPKIWQKDFWKSPEINSCFPSDQVDKNQSILRINNLHSASDWEIPVIKKETSNLDTTENKKTTSKKTTNSISVDEESTIPDDSPLIITEIYPAPKNKDQVEWIEIHNISNQKISLENWIIDDAEGGSKPKRIPTIILNPGSYYQLLLKDLKINLNNTNDQIRIFDSNGLLMASKEYENAEKGKSFALITIDDQEDWRWTEKISPGLANLALTTLEGTLTTDAQFDQIYHFDLTDQDQNKILVQFSEKTIKGPLAKETFIIGSSGKFTGLLSDAPANENNYLGILNLEQFEILQTNNDLSKENSPPITFIGTILLVLSAAYFLYKKAPSWFLTLTRSGSTQLPS